MSCERPNIVVFLTDDHGQWAARCYENTELITPNMDYLATSGVKMNQAYTPSPVCSPARACLYTGRLPSQHGIHDWLREHDLENEHPGLTGEVTIAELLQQEGYYTGLVGKWHCGRGCEPKPGFDRWFSYQVNQYPHFGAIRFSDQGKPIEQQGHQTPFLTDQAISFLRQRPKDKPFLLFVNYVNTHSPHSGQPERWVSAYRKCSFRDIPDEGPSKAHGRPCPPWAYAVTNHREELAQYYAAVSFIDEQIGRVLDELEGMGALENTLVVYTSDHGHMTGRHGLHSKGNATVPQNFIDDSILVPCLLFWKKGLPTGAVRNEPVDHCDLFRTLLDAAGVATKDLEEELNLPGRSYLPLIRGESDRAPWRTAQFCEYGNARMIRTQEYKLIRRYPGPNGHFPDELYDLENDPWERVNRVNDLSLSDVKVELSRQLDAHFSQYEIPGRSGIDVARQPLCNGHEPWHLDSETGRSMVER
jgi:choline-sulfatase